VPGDFHQRTCHLAEKSGLFEEKAGSRGMLGCSTWGKNLLPKKQLHKIAKV